MRWSSILDSWAGRSTAASTTSATPSEAYLILDQFEEYFLYHDGEPGTLLE